MENNRREYIECTAYAWPDSDGNFTAVLGVPPATDPRNAVKVSIVAASKKRS